ncbi:hypothetical protein ZWY2020_042245 [Hordeum vulgare]|nr:hypothetical protein ZWY2020_042245 [Hordeum vulgare]
MPTPVRLRAEPPAVAPPFPSSAPCTPPCRAPKQPHPWNRAPEQQRCKPALDSLPSGPRPRPGAHAAWPRCHAPSRSTPRALADLTDAYSTHAPSRTGATPRRTQIQLEACLARPCTASPRRLEPA